GRVCAPRHDPHLQSCREVRLRVGEDLQNGRAIVGSEMPEIRTLVLTAEHLAKSTMDVALHGVRQRIEAVRINQVAERVAEDMMLEVQIAERAAAAIARPGLGEFRGKR